MYQREEVKFTKHALERIKDRKISQEMVIETVLNPDKTYNETDGGMKFIRTVNGRLVHVVCRPLLEERKWLVKSAWVRGEDNQGNEEVYKPKYRREQESWASIALVILFFLIVIVGLLLFFQAW